MGFFDKVKNSLNIGGVSIQLQGQPEYNNETFMVKGNALLTTKAEKLVKYIVVEVQEERTETPENTEEFPKTENTSLGYIQIPVDVTLQPGEEKVVSFELKLDNSYAKNPALKPTLGISFGEGDNIHYEYNLRVSAGVDGAISMPAANTNLPII